MCGKKKKRLSEWWEELELLPKFTLGLGALLFLDLIVWLFS